jgi:hypothetical protein
MKQDISTRYAIEGIPGFEQMPKDYSSSGFAALQSEADNQEVVRASALAKALSSGDPKFIRQVNDAIIEANVPLLKAVSDSDEPMMKALTTGNGIVQAGDTGGRALRVQFLQKTLQSVSFDNQDVFVMKNIPHKDAKSVAVEWTNFTTYNSQGDGFSPESGLDGNFNGNAEDAGFSRQLQNVKFLITAAQVSVVASLVQNIENPEVAAQTAATLRLLARAELNMFNGDSTLSNTQYNGIEAQIIQNLDINPQDSVGSIYDAGGQALSYQMLQDICVQNALQFGNPSLLINSWTTKADIANAIFPQGRFGIDQNTNGFKFVPDSFDYQGGKVKLGAAKFLRANHPLAMEGPGLTGQMRNSSTVDALALVWGTSPFANSGAVPTPAVAGTGNFWRNFTRNTDSGAVPAPSLPAGGNNSNRLSAGTYCYAVSIVYQGWESLPWVYGASAAGTLTGASAVTVSTGDPIVALTVDTTTPAVTGLGSTYPRNIVKFRWYRAPSANASSWASYQYLGETGTPIAGNAVLYDNGYSIPGADKSYLITEAKNGISGWGWYQLLPLMKRALPNLLMADQFGELLFGTLALMVARHHTVIRNIGRYTA